MVFKPLPPPSLNGPKELNLYCLSRPDTTGLWFFKIIAFGEIVVGFPVLFFFFFFNR